MQEAAGALGLHIRVLRADFDFQIEAAFETIAQHDVAALVVGGSPFFDTRRDKLIGLAARHAVPAMYEFREFAVAGGLVSYGIDIIRTYRQVGIYVGKFSRAPYRPFYLFSSRPNLNWSLTSRQQRRSA